MLIISSIRLQLNLHFKTSLWRRRSESLRNKSAYISTSLSIYLSLSFSHSLSFSCLIIIKGIMRMSYDVQWIQNKISLAASYTHPLNKLKSLLTEPPLPLLIILYIYFIGFLSRVNLFTEIFITTFIKIESPYSPVAFLRKSNLNYLLLFINKSYYALRKIKLDLPDSRRK